MTQVTDPTAAFEPSPVQRRALRALLTALVDPQRAHVAVAPTRGSDGFWFGGGDLVADPDDREVLWLSGRYRDAGDSRTGVAAGRRGWKLAILRSEGGGAFEEVAAFGKDELALEHRVLSVEGSSLQPLPGGAWELLLSSEKARPYPTGWSDRQKAGTGVWSIDRLTGASPDALGGLEPALASDDPAALHVKDPVLRGDHLLYSVHPATWASSNTGLATRTAAGAPFVPIRSRALARGDVWDVAATRVTELLALPRVGVFADGPPLWLLPYDGAECMRPHGEPRSGRPRGWSCEELGGALLAPAGRVTAAVRLSEREPWFVSPWGTGSSRYLKIAALTDRWVASWQQARADGSQPLVMHALPLAEVERLLGA